MEEDELSTTPRKTQMKVPLISFTVTLVALMVLLIRTNPGVGGPTLILLFLALLFLNFFSLTGIILATLGKLIKSWQFSVVRQLYTAVCIAAGAVFLVGLQTLSQLQLVDVVLVGVFELLLNFYLLRRF